MLLLTQTWASYIRFYIQAWWHFSRKCIDSSTGQYENNHKVRYRRFTQPSYDSLPIHCGHSAWNTFATISKDDLGAERWRPVKYTYMHRQKRFKKTKPTVVRSYVYDGSACKVKASADKGVAKDEHESVGLTWDFIHLTWARSCSHQTKEFRHDSWKVLIVGQYMAKQKRPFHSPTGVQTKWIQMDKRKYKSYECS